MALKFIGERTVGTLNGMKSGFVKDDLYRIYDAGILVPGGVAVDHGDFVSWDGTKWVKEADIKIARSDEITNTNSNIAPDYTKTTYPANSYVMHDGVLYTNENAIGTAEDWNPAHWTQTTVAEMMAGAGNSGYNHKDVTVTQPYTVSVSQKDYLHLTGIVYNGGLTINIDDDCTDAIIDLGGNHIRITSYTIKKGNNYWRLCGADLVTNLSVDSDSVSIDVEGNTYYSDNNYVTTVSSETASQGYSYAKSFIEIKDGFAVFHAG